HQIERQMAVLQSLPRIADRFPAPAIPNVDVPRTVLPSRNIAFELPVLERMIFDLHCEPALADVFARPSRDRPALQHTVQLETKIEMELARLMPLYHEAVLLRAARLRTTWRLVRDVEIALAAIGRERGRHRRHSKKAAQAVFHLH